MAVELHPPQDSSEPSNPAVALLGYVCGYFPIELRSVKMLCFILARWCITRIFCGLWTRASPYLNIPSTLTVVTELDGLPRIRYRSIWINLNCITATPNTTYPTARRCLILTLTNAALPFFSMAMNASARLEARNADSSSCKGMKIESKNKIFDKDQLSALPLPAPPAPLQRSSGRR